MDSPSVTKKVVGVFVRFLVASFTKLLARLFDSPLYRETGYSPFVANDEDAVKKPAMLYSFFDR
jgi:hypothetical protein